MTKIELFNYFKAIWPFHHIFYKFQASKLQILLIQQLEIINRQIQQMHSQRETLFEYIQRQNNHRSLKKQTTDESSKAQKLKQIPTFISLKKNNISTLISQMMNEVKKNAQKDQNFLKLQKMLRTVTQQLKNDFDQISQFVQLSIPSENHSSNEQMPYVIMINQQKLQNNPDDSTDLHVLRQVRSNKKQKILRSEKCMKSDKKEIENLKITNPRVKERSHRSKQNSRVIEIHIRNPEEDFDCSGTEDILNKAFERKQQAINFQKGRTIFKAK